MGMLIRIKVAIFGRAEAEGIGGKFWTAPAESAITSEEFRLEKHVPLDTIAPNNGNVQGIYRGIVDNHARFICSVQ